ncbi:MAG: hypothetical protein ACLP2H_18545 [Terriglobales bacterium]
MALAQKKGAAAAPAQHSAPAAHAPAPAARAPQSAPRQGAPSSAQRGPSTAGRPNTGAGATRGANTAGGANTRGTTNTRGTSTAGGANASRGTTNTRGTGAAGGANASRGTTNTRGTGAAGGANAKGGAANTRGTGAAGGANAKGGASNAGKTNAGAGAKASPAARGTTTKQVTTHSGAKVTVNSRGGNVRSIQAHNMRIDHGVHGGRHVVTERNGRRVVGMGHGRGYSERAYYNHGGRSYYQRTYYMGGRRYAYAYRGYYYHGARYYGYAPAYYYHPAYYGWAYNPWPAPVYYNWGWAGNPWYGAYGYYYEPYPAYAAAPFWLTDYMISANLQAAYEAGLAEGAAGTASLAPDTNLFAALESSDPLVAANLEAAYGGALYASAVKGSSQTQVSKDVKDALADQVKAQIAADKSAAESPKTASGSSGHALATPAVILLPLMFAPPAAADKEETPPALDPKFRYFVVASEVDLTPADGKECPLTQGDVIQRTSDQLDENNNVEVIVKSSKKADCAVGTKGPVDANDLQEMYNHFRETLDAGLKSLAENSGKNGVPAAPDTGTTAGEVPAPTPDTNVDSDLQQQQKDADQMEAEVKQGSGGQ